MVLSYLHGEQYDDALAIRPSRVAGVGDLGGCVVRDCPAHRRRSMDVKYHRSPYQQLSQFGGSHLWLERGGPCNSGVANRAGS